MADRGFIEKATLTAIADAIRAKTETTEEMLPSKMAELITAIETGVNLPGITAIETGTHTPTANQQSFYVYHSLGIRPNFFVVIASDFSELSTSSSARGKAFICYFTEKGNSQTYFRSVDSYISSSTYFPASLTLDGAYYTNVSSERVFVQAGSSTQRFTSGVTYIWIAGVIEAMVSIA